MEHLSLEIFNLEGNGSVYANLPENANITITDTSEIFASGDVWSYSFKLNIYANAHIFGSAGDLHGSRLHEQVNKRRARLWIMGVPIYLGYLKLGDEVEVDEDGDVSVTFESGQKTFRNMIEGMNAREVSVGEVEIGIALNRKRVISAHAYGWSQLSLLGIKDDENHLVQAFNLNWSGNITLNSYTARWPKLVASHSVYIRNNDTGWSGEIDKTNVDHPYGEGYPFCNINVCYQKKVLDADNNEKKVRGYILRLGHGSPTTNGGDNQTRYNNAPNFFLLYWLDRLFKDKGVIVQENQMMNVDTLRRVFLANLGCFYEEMDTDNDKDEMPPGSPEREHYGNFTFHPGFIVSDGQFYDWSDSDGHQVRLDEVKVNGQRSLGVISSPLSTLIEYDYKSPLTGYRAFATGDNYPDVEASEIINSTEAAFGVRFLFNRDFTAVRIILLRNVFQNNDVQDIECEVTKDEKVENNKRGFVLTYGGDEDDTNYNYDDWSRLDTSKSYKYIREKAVTSFNKTCYITPNNGNAYRIKIDEDEDVLFPVLAEVGGYSDAKDGDCDGEDDTIETVTIPAKPLIMNDVDGILAVLFNGDMKAPGVTIPIVCFTSIAQFNTSGKLAITTYDSDKMETEKRLAELYDTLAEAQNNFMISGSIPYIQAEIDKLSLTKHYQEYDIEVRGEAFAKEGYLTSLQDNYNFEGNDGTPFDKANIGLCFGIMRGSGFDSFIFYNGDNNDREGNDYWERVPGNSVIDHPDTCDGNGNKWDNSGDIERGAVPETFHELFPLRDAEYFHTLLDYGVGIFYVNNVYGKEDAILMRIPTAAQYGKGWEGNAFAYYVGQLAFGSHEQQLQWDQEELCKDGWGIHWKNLIIEFDSNQERSNTLNQLIRFYKRETNVAPVIINGVSTPYGDFSLKLRAEKKNPNFNPDLPETHYDPAHPEANTNPRYQTITDENLRGRGLADQFYKEYSYWVRNARVVKRTVKIELAQLLAIDKTKRVKIADVTGFIRKIQYSVSNKTGLGLATFEIMYI